jgi:hypothetical protein
MPLLVRTLEDAGLVCCCADSLVQVLWRCRLQLVSDMSFAVISMLFAVISMLLLERPLAGCRVFVTQKEWKLCFIELSFSSRAEYAQRGMTFL